jgi:hypothetical protein
MKRNFPLLSDSTANSGHSQSGSLSPRHFVKLQTSFGAPPVCAIHQSTFSIMRRACSGSLAHAGCPGSQALGLCVFLLGSLPSQQSRQLAISQSLSVLKNADITGMSHSADALFGADGISDSGQKVCTSSASTASVWHAEDLASFSRRICNSRFSLSRCSGPSPVRCSFGKSCASAEPRCPNVIYGGR